MSFDMEFDDDLAQRRLHRLEHRCRRAQNALGGARAVYGALRELPGASALQLHQALQQVERMQQTLADIQFDIEHAEAQGEPHENRSRAARWDSHRR